MKYFKLILIAVFLSGLFLRLFVINLAHHGDLNNNISWGTIAYEKGLKDFYEGYYSIKNWPYSAPNQPPLTILLFALCSFVWQHIRNFIWYMNWELLIFPSRLVWFWDERGMDILVKLPSIIADLGIGYLIYNYFASKKKQYLGFILSSVWLFNPLVWYNSSVWGQTDSIVNLLGLFAIIALLNKKLVKFSVFFTLSFLFKGSLGTFIPILLFVALFQKHPFSLWLKASIYCLAIIALISIWFHPYLDIYPWLLKLYYVQILPGEIGFLTANSFNLWWLVDSGKVMDSTVYLWLSSRMWGYIFTITGNIFVIYWLLRKEITDKRLFLALSIVALLSFLFMTRIHERYLYPFFPNATLLIAFIPGFWFIYAVISLIHLVNLYNYFWVPDLYWLKDLLISTNFPKILSVINILALPFIIFLNSFKPTKKI